MNDATSLPRALLTVDQVRGWEVERDAERARVEEGLARIEVLDRKLEAVSLLLDDEARRELSNLRDAAHPSHAAVGPEEDSHLVDNPQIVTVRAVAAGENRRLNDILLHAERGLSEAEILQETASDAAQGLMPSTPRALRGLIESMTRRGRLRRRGGFIYHPVTLQKIEVGLLENRPEAAEAVRSDLRGLIIQALSEIGNARAKSVIAKLWTMPEAMPILERNPQYPYAMLSRMAQAGELDRAGNLYCLPQDAVGVEVSHSPDMHEPETPEEMPSRTAS
jgi:hypothetical protein